MAEAGVVGDLKTPWTGEEKMVRWKEPLFPKNFDEESVELAESESVIEVRLRIRCSAGMVSIASIRVATDVSNANGGAKCADLRLCRNEEEEMEAGTNVMRDETDEEKILLDSPTKLLEEYLSSSKTTSLLGSVSRKSLVPYPSCWEIPGAMPSPWCDSDQASWPET